MSCKWAYPVKLKQLFTILVVLTLISSFALPTIASAAQPQTSSQTNESQATTEAYAPIIDTFGDGDKDQSTITVQLSLKVGANNPEFMELKVDAGVSEQYGFPDMLKGDAVALLDVLVAAHIQYYDIVDADGNPLTTKEGVTRLGEVLVWDGRYQNLDKAFDIDQVNPFMFVDGIMHFNSLTSKYTAYGLDSPIDDEAQIALRVTQQRDFDVYWEVGKLVGFTSDGLPSWWYADADISENYGFFDAANGTSVTVLDVLVSVVCEWWGLDTSIEGDADAMSDWCLEEISKALAIKDGVVTKAFGYDLERLEILVNDQPATLDTVISAYDWDNGIGDTVQLLATPVVYPTNPELDITWQVDGVIWDTTRLKVPASLSEQNGFIDDYDGELPTLLDVLVAAHIEQFGQVSERTWPDFLHIAKDGSLDVVFGIDGKRLRGLTATVNGYEVKDLGGTVLKQLDNTVFAVSVVPRQTPAPVVSVKVNLRFGGDSGYRIPYEFDLAGDLSERYGLTDNYSGNAVTLLDALVATHISRHGIDEGRIALGRVLRLHNGEIVRLYGFTGMLFEATLVDNAPYLGLLSTRLTDGAGVDFHAYDPLLAGGSGTVEGDWPIGEADDTSALVLLDYRMGADFVLSQRHLPANLSERYGYADDFNGEVPTALDALVQTIILRFGSAPEVVNRVLRVDEDGTVGNNLYGMGYGTQGIFFFINGEMVTAGDYRYDEVLDATVATPLPAGQLALHDGDLVQIWLPALHYRQSDGSFSVGDDGEMVVWFEQRDASGKWTRPKGDTITAEQWELVQYRIVGYPLAYARADAAAREKHTVAVQTQVTVIDEQGHSLGQPWGTGTDGIGNIWLADHAGNLTLVAGMASNVTLDALLHVQVNPAPAANTDQEELQGLMDKLTAWELRNTDFGRLDAGSQQAVVGLMRSRPLVSQTVRDDYRLLDIDVYDLLGKIMPTAIAGDGKLDASGPERNMQAMFVLRAMALGTEAIEETGLVAPLADIAWDTADGAKSAAQALLALDSSMDQGTNNQGYLLPVDIKTDSSVRQLLLDYLLDAQSNGTWGDATTTATVLTALAPYVKHPGDDAQVLVSTSYAVFMAVADALTALGQIQDAGGGFGSTQANARVIVALGSLGVPLDDDVLVKDGNTVLDALMQSFVELPATADTPAMGAFNAGDSAGGKLQKSSVGLTPLDLTADKDATDWGLYALSSVYRSLDVGARHTRFFDFSDIQVLFQHPIAHPGDEDNDSGSGGSGNSNSSGDSESSNSSGNGTGNTQTNNPSILPAAQVELYLNGNDASALETIVSSPTPLALGSAAVAPGIFGSPGANPPAANASSNPLGSPRQIGDLAGDNTVLIMIAGFGVLAIAAAVGVLIKLGALGAPRK